MSTSSPSPFDFASRQIAIYCGSFMAVTGLLGAVLTILVFLSLQTFRRSACAFYLTVMSFVNIGQLITSLITRVLIDGFNVNWTLTSLAYCKFRWFGIQFCTLTSFTCVCLATIDQFMATSSTPRWRQWSKIESARVLIAVFVSLWVLHGIPYVVFYDQIELSSTGKLTCALTNAKFQQYNQYGYVIILVGILPVFITVLFGSLAYRNVQQLAHRTLPLVRRELDKQLTVMVLLQVVHNLSVSLPILVMNILTVDTNLSKNPGIAAQIQFVSLITIYLFYLNFVSPFYIYICASERFRRQLIYVLIEVHQKRCRPPRIAVNQVSSQV